MRVGFIGVGQMGKWMAEHLLNAGYEVTIFDKNPDEVPGLQEKGARAASSVSELGRENNFVITMLPNSTVVEEVVAGVDGLFSAMMPGGVIIDMSSSYVLSTRRLAEDAKLKKLAFLDAPVSGGVKGAREGTLTIMVGGNPDDFQTVLPILQHIGKKITLVGQTGAGHALKALNNYLSAASLYATTEAMVLAKTLGLDLNVALESINTSSGQSYSTHYKFPNFVLPRTFDSGFSLELLLKDVKMATSLARDNKVPVFLASAVEQIYEAALRSGDPNLDHTEVVKFLEGITHQVLS